MTNHDAAEALQPSRPLVETYVGPNETVVVSRHIEPHLGIDTVKDNSTVFRELKARLEADIGGRDAASDPLDVSRTDFVIIEPDTLMGAVLRMPQRGSEVSAYSFTITGQGMYRIDDRNGGKQHDFLLHNPDGKTIYMARRYKHLHAEPGDFGPQPEAGPAKAVYDAVLASAAQYDRVRAAEKRETPKRRKGFFAAFGFRRPQ